MAVSNSVRRLRGIVGNAIVWGAAWFTIAIAVFSVVHLLGGTGSWLGLLQLALRCGVMGGIAGTVFSTFISLRYQGQRIANISWIRFGIGGGIVTALFVPGFIILMRFLSGDPPLAVNALLSNGLFGAVFGGAAAAGSIRIAQLAAGYVPGEGNDPQELPGRIAAIDRKSQG